MIEPVKGFSDYTGEEAEKREKIREILVRNFKLYGFQAAEAPIIEQEEFVKGENEFDEAVSDIFKLKDKGNRNLALRYEMTFQLKRLALNKKLPYKRFTIGPVFRDEPVTGNRFRQFTQCDIDIIGSTVKEEAEILALTARTMKELGIEAEINVNNRKLLNSVIKSLGIDNQEFVLRQIDKIDKQGEDHVKSELAKFIDKETIVKLFKLLGKKTNLNKFEGYKELAELIKLCKVYDVKIIFNPFLARGLSYYNGSVFEIKTREMKETISAGGSYLINGIQATGISFGLERLTALAKIKPDNRKVLIISIEKDKESIGLGEKLRKQKIEVSIMYGKPSKALEYANSYQIPYVIFLGKDEAKKRKVKLRDMKTGKEELLKDKELIERLA